MKTYWNGDGKYQDWYDKIADTMPSMYDTDNTLKEAKKKYEKELSGTDRLDV